MIGALSAWTGWQATVTLEAHIPAHARRVSWKSSKKSKKDIKKKGADLYALLGLKNERFLATPKQIKDGGWPHGIQGA